MSMLLFYVGENCYAIESRYILRIVPQVVLKKMSSASYIAGFLNLGGKAVPIVDFCQLIEHRTAPLLFSSRIILIRDPLPGSERVLGILGEKVQDLLNVNLEQFSPTDFPLAPFPYLNRVLSNSRGIIQYLNIEEFFRFLAADLFQSAEKEDHGS